VSQTSSRLEEISIRFIPRMSLWDDLNIFDWEGLSECLSAPKFSRLKKFNIHIGSNLDGMFDVAERMVRERLPKFSHMPRVEVSFAYVPFVPRYVWVPLQLVFILFINCRM
jgi:hypothetical protein